MKVTKHSTTVMSVHYSRKLKQKIKSCNWLSETLIVQHSRMTSTIVCHCTLRPPCWTIVHSARWLEVPTDNAERR